MRRGRPLVSFHDAFRRKGGFCGCLQFVQCDTVDGPSEGIQSHIRWDQLIPFHDRIWNERVEVWPSDLVRWAFVGSVAPCEGSDQASKSDS